MDFELRSLSSSSTLGSWPGSLEARCPPWREEGKGGGVCGRLPPPVWRFGGAAILGNVEPRTGRGRRHELPASQGWSVLVAAVHSLPSTSRALRWRVELVGNCGLLGPSWVEIHERRSGREWPGGNAPTGNGGSRAHVAPASANMGARA